MSIQLRCPTHSGTNSSGLQIHADRGDGTPACGMPPRSWVDPKTGIRHATQYVVVTAPVDCTRNGCA